MDITKIYGCSKGVLSIHDMKSFKTHGYQPRTENIKSRSVLRCPFQITEC